MMMMSLLPSLPWWWGNYMGCILPWCQVMGSEFAMHYDTLEQTLHAQYDWQTFCAPPLELLSLFVTLRRVAIIWKGVCTKGQSYQSTLAVLPGRKRSAERWCSAGQSWPGTCTVRLGSRCRSVFKTREFRFDYLTHMIDGIEKMSFVYWHFLASRILAEISSVINLINFGPNQ